MKFSRLQKEIVAAFFNAIAASAIVAAIASLSGQFVTSPVEMTLLITSAFVLFVLAFIVSI